MKVSVIIPALNESANIAAAILSARNQDGEIEVIVADGGSSDDTVEIARRDAHVLSTGRGRGLQMNAGAGHAIGDLLLFLHADSLLHPDALAALRRTFTDPAIVGGTFTLKFDSEGFWLGLYSVFTRLKFRYFHYGDQGIFVRRSAFEKLGGFKEIPLMEDLDFLERLRKVGRVTLIDRPVTTSARRFRENGSFRQELLNVLLVCLYILGAKPATLARWYSRDWSKFRWLFLSL
ncbi:MAG TPA: TIGR04283 family arsenosugar biosynthesis glycosyltransferase [Blastocatellia bacterium]|nr:TIGR04283 family arsenosugar biosynthesis glycosyltransferase [Blastocatellia bacterium]